MAVRTKSNRRKPKSRTRHAKPLLRRNGDVRTSDKVPVALARSLPEQPHVPKESNPVASRTSRALLMSQFPFEVWRAQTILACQGLMMIQAMAFGRL
jgi:hypothetical protein